MIYITNILNKITNLILINQELLTNYIINIIFALIIFFIGIIITKFIEHWIQNIMIIKNIDTTINYLLSTIFRYILITFTLIIVLNKIGIKTAPIIAIIGTIGLAFGLAIQNSLKNFISGILLIILRPLKVGEHVIICSIEGYVKKIQFFFTIIKTIENSIAIIPNDKIINNNIINLTNKKNIQQNIIISVDHNSNINTTKEILYKILKDENRIQQNNGMFIRLYKISPYSLDYIINFWTTNNDAWPVYLDLLKNLKQKLYNSNINIISQEIC
ncbi:mechanosensitive ion channel domain-containing protein [Candidatus Providencia siddallii]|uniref:Small-conductance mechanosensitive channel n=1 Tax=Candidatus Providencia siddallii TaxID=1715285 RepID=A0ABM9NNZ7_9GAMM